MHGRFPIADSRCLIWADQIANSQRVPGILYSLRSSSHKAECPLNLVGEHRGFRSTDLRLSNGAGAEGFWHVGNYRARDDQLTFLAFIARQTRVDVQQVISRQRPPQVCDTNIRGDSVTVLRSGARADFTVFGHSHDSNDDRADRKQRDHDQPNSGRR